MTFQPKEKDEMLDEQTIDAPAVDDPVAPATKPLKAVTPLALVTKQLAAFSKVEAGFSKVEHRHKDVVYDVSTTKGINEAKAAREELRGYRYSAQTMLKDIKKPLNQLKADATAAADSFIARVVEYEDPVDKQIKTEEDRKAAEKAERERIERERIGAIHDRIATFDAVVTEAVSCKTAAQVRAILTALENAEVGEDEFAEFIDEAFERHASAVRRVREILSAKVEQEAQAAKDAADREAERQRLADERAEFERQRKADADAKAERDRLQAIEDKRRADEHAAETKRLQEAADAAQKMLDDQAAELNRQREEFRLEQEAATARTRATIAAVTVYDDEDTGPLVPYPPVPNVPMAITVLDDATIAPLSDSEIICYAVASVSNQFDITAEAAARRLSQITNWTIEGATQS
jgi:hypothetical protein